MTKAWPPAGTTSSRLARRSEEIGFDLTLIAELNLNDIKGIEAPSLDAWSTAGALAAVTRTLELMVAVRPTFHAPALLAKQAANIDHISNGRLSINVVSSWWATRSAAVRRGLRHTRRTVRADRRVAARGRSACGSEPRFSYSGKYYSIEDAVLEPKPVQLPRPTVYAGGESPAAKALIAQTCDAWLTHGDPPEIIARKVADMRARRERLGLAPMRFGAAGYAIVRDSEAEARRELERITNVRQNARGFANYQEWISNTQLEQRVSLEDYSVSNRGLRSGLVGTPEQVAVRIREFEERRSGLAAPAVQPAVRRNGAFRRGGHSTGQVWCLLADRGSRRTAVAVCWIRPHREQLVLSASSLIRDPRSARSRPDLPIPSAYLWACPLSSSSCPFSWPATSPRPSRN